VNDATSDIMSAVEQIIQLPDTNADNVQVSDTKSEEPTKATEAAPEQTQEIESEDQT
jgi:4-hydroxy-3-methylbut-2-en-1-yl diphosphate synthase IspG/GcpE